MKVSKESGPSGGSPAGTKGWQPTCSSLDSHSFFRSVLLFLCLSFLIRQTILSLKSGMERISVKEVEVQPGNIRMNIETLPVNLETLTEYSSIPMIYEVKEMLSPELIDNGLKGIMFREEVITPSFIRDFDALDGDKPTRWLNSFNVSNWVMFIAREKGVPLGGATVVTRTPEVNMLKGRDDLAVLWDIRVKPECKRTGIGTRLFQAAANWSGKQGFRYMKIESQNINLPACRFYTKQGCRLGEVNRFAYTNPESVNETMLVWYLDLNP